MSRSTSARRCVAVLIAVVMLMVACGGSDSAPDSTTSAEGSRPATTEPVAQPTASQALSDPAPSPPSEPTPTTDGEAADPDPAEPTAAADPDPAADARYDDIRAVDFENDFTYDTGTDYVPTATVVDGRYEQGEPRGVDYFGFFVGSVNYGDLDGDGAEEAVVATSWNGGGTGYFDRVTAFRLVDGTVESAGSVAFGDRGDGGVQGVRVDDGRVQVRSFSTTQGACCPDQISTVTLMLGDARFVTVDRSPTIAFTSTQRGDQELKFVPGTSAALLSMYGAESEEGFFFEAGAGQRLAVEIVDGAVPEAVFVTARSTQEPLSALDPIILPADDIYDIRFVFTGPDRPESLARLTIESPDANADATAPPTWKSTLSQTLLHQDPLVYTSLAWPIFEPAFGASNDAPNDLGAANNALAAFVAELDDYWIEDVTEYSDPQGESSYELDYTVTLATPDLVSVRFDFLDYVCCRPYPGYGPVGATVDLVEGRVLDVGEILDLNRLGEIQGIWLSELDKSSGYDVSYVEIEPGELGFDAIAVHPDGIEFGTERGALGGGSPGTLTLVPFADLGDLVLLDR